ncbi:MAG: GrpB family protein [Clostridia bacterium]|nr:GrpB family protein [Clostridia bacterium]MBQ4158794.1 GrpB family protein [Clostridia bacterium]
MTLEELWALFPIILTEHDERWSDWYNDEEACLKPLLPGSAKIHHIGSTAVSGIWAKPIIDILIETADENELASAVAVLKKNGYLLMNQTSARASLNKGYTQQGFAEKVFHIHIRLCGDNDEIYFRNYLNENRDAAKEYEALKLQLWKRFEHDRDGYTAAKAEMVKKYTEIAKKKY